MSDYSKKISNFLLTVFILTAIFFSGSAQASLWDTIKAWVTINPLFVDVSAPAKVEINQVFKVEAKIINKGEEKIENAKAEIILPEGLILFKNDPIQEIGVILGKKEKGVTLGKKEKRIFWLVKGEGIGEYFISISVSGELKGQLVSAEDTAMVKVIKPIPKGKAWGWFQNLFDFFQERFGF